MKNGILLCLLVLFGGSLSAQVSIKPIVEASEIVGVAPMPIFFDATTSTINEAETNTFHELYYQWNFGDFFSGFWTNVPKSKNRASGPLAAHVFDSIGLHIVELEIFKNTEYSVLKPFTIKVKNANDFYKGKKTICFSINGEFVDVPHEATRVQINDLADVIPYICDSTRLLFRRGDTILASRGLDFSNVEFLTVGAYGPRLNIDSFEISSNAPVIEMLGETPVFTLGDTDTLHQSQHLKIIDLNIYNKNPDNHSSAIVANGETAFNLLYRLKIKDFAKSVFYNQKELEQEGQISPKTVELYKEIFIANCVIENETQKGDLVELNGEKIAIIGNHFNNHSQDGNVLHLNWAQKAIVSNNRLLNAGAFKHCLKLSAPNADYCTTKDILTNEVIISDNDFATKNGVRRLVSIQKEEENDETIQNVIVSRNYFNALNDKKVRVGLYAAANHFTIKNNIINGTGASYRYFTGVLIDNPFGEELNHISITNNTIFKSDWVDLMTGIRIEKDIDNSFIANNLVYSPNAMDLEIVKNLGNFTIDKRNIFPFIHPFIKKMPKRALDFQLDSVSLVLDNGISQTVAHRDFFEKERSSKTRIDIGAFQFTENPITTYNIGEVASTNLDEMTFASSRYYTMDMSKFTAKYDVEVYNADGDLVRADRNLRDMFYTWQTEGYESGVYWLMIKSKNASVMTKVFIQK